MDNMKIDGGILNNSVRISDSGHVLGFGLTQPKPTPAQQILPMIEQRIRKEVEPKARQAEGDLLSAIITALKTMDIDPDDVGAYLFANKVYEMYRERLVGKRIKAIVDGLVSEKPTQPQADTRCKCEAQAWRELMAEPVIK